MNSNSKIIVHIFLITITIFFYMSFAVSGASLYKRYMVRHIQGDDILCEPYIIKKNDYVFKLFRQKGELSTQDFPYFLNLFKNINSHIKDIDKILPGQQILIPLKKIDPFTLPGQNSGIVDVPFISIYKIIDLLKQYSYAHKVQKGESVSTIISKKFGQYGTQLYEQGVKIFKKLNPEIKNIDLIYPDQDLKIPDKSLAHQSWYTSIFDSSGNIVKDVPEQFDNQNYHKQQETDTPQDPLQQTASIMGATLLNKGCYYFPRQDKQDLELDLSKCPVFKLKNGKRLLFTSESYLRKSEEDTIKLFWKDTDIIQIPYGADSGNIIDNIAKSLEKQGKKNSILLSDNGIEFDIRANLIIENISSNSTQKICLMLINSLQEACNKSISKHLKIHNIIIKEMLKNSSDDLQNLSFSPRPDSAPPKIIPPSQRRVFVNAFIKSLGLNYAQNTTINFPYNNIEVKALSNLVSGHRQEMLIDFGDIYGDAIDSIKKTGLNCIIIKEKDSFSTIVTKILDGLEYIYNRPIFLAAKRDQAYNISIKIPGFFIKKHNLLIATVPIQYNIIEFLQEQNIQIVVIPYSLPEPLALNTGAI